VIPNVNHGIEDYWEALRRGCRAAFGRAGYNGRSLMGVQENLKLTTAWFLAPVSHSADMCCSKKGTSAPSGEPAGDVAG